MKKAIVILFLIVSMLLGNYIVVWTESSDEPPSIVEVIRNQGDYLPTDNIFNAEKYDETMEGFDLSDDLLLKVCLFPAFSVVGKDYDEQIEIAKNSFALLHVAFRDEIYTFQELRDGTITRKNTVEDSNAAGYYNYEIKKPKFIQDIIDSSIYHSKLHLSNTEYTRIVCFAAEHSHETTCVYYVGNNRTIVRCYQHYDAEGVDILLEDFTIYASAYYEFLLKHGDWNGGGSFVDFTKSMTVEEAKAYLEQTKDGGIVKDNQTDKGEILVWMVPVAVVVLLGTVVSVFTFMRKKKRQF